MRADCRELTAYESDRNTYISNLLASGRISIRVTQLASFDDQIAGPKGLRYTPDFMSATTERELIATVFQKDHAQKRLGAMMIHPQIIAL